MPKKIDNGKTQDCKQNLYSRPGQSTSKLHSVTLAMKKANASIVVRYAALGTGIFLVILVDLLKKIVVPIAASLVGFGLGKL
jgi:hypothetical protein